MTEVIICILGFCFGVLVAAIASYLDFERIEQDNMEQEVMKWQK